jgi:hypothetical protein
MRSKERSPAGRPVRRAVVAGLKGGPAESWDGRSRWEGLYAGPLRVSRMGRGRRRGIGDPAVICIIFDFTSHRQRNKRDGRGQVPRVPYYWWDPVNLGRINSSDWKAGETRQKRPDCCAARYPSFPPL